VFIKLNLEFLNEGARIARGGRAVVASIDLSGRNPAAHRRYRLLPPLLPERFND